MSLVSVSKKWNFFSWLDQDFIPPHVCQEAILIGLSLLYQDVSPLGEGERKAEECVMKDEKSTTADKGQLVFLTAAPYQD